MNYDSSMKYKWDNENVLVYAVQQEKEKTAKKLKDLGVSLVNISIATGLSIEEIQELSHPE